MDTQSINKNERLAKTSRILGIISSGFLLLTFLIGLWIRFSDFDEFKKLALLSWVAYSFLGSLITGLPGCSIAVIALRKNKAAGDDPGIKRIAVTGLILGSLEIVTILIFFIYFLLFGPSGPLPGPQTPIPSTVMP